MYPEYDAFDNDLMNLQAGITPAELQGIMIGFYAAGMPLAHTDWLQQVLQLVGDDRQFQNALKDPMLAIQQRAITELTEAQGSLTMMVHNDEAFIVDRAESLVYWCQGFILGFESMSGEKTLRDEQAKEAYSDLKEITQLDLDSIQETAEDEKQLYAIQDHIKISALLIYHSQDDGGDTTSQSIH